ncbi:hypothetical protein NDU88_004249 [Pleurodeles waltl]|uniref:Uncharacterized protein n=1 Tax=Pleurodeles waltl TaxID=8319 RepID=A0AAV7VIS1_PLEWA|nr:hypothetical protein NDU88_004249 [Pleurodeles waltl]
MPMLRLRQPPMIHQQQSNEAVVQPSPLNVTSEVREGPSALSRHCRNEAPDRYINTHKAPIKKVQVWRMALSQGYTHNPIRPATVSKRPGPTLCPGAHHAPTRPRGPPRPPPGHQRPPPVSRQQARELTQRRPTKNLSPIISRTVWPARTRPQPQLASRLAFQLPRPLKPWPEIATDKAPSKILHAPIRLRNRRHTRQAPESGGGTPSGRPRRVTRPSSDRPQENNSGSRRNRSLYKGIKSQQRKASAPSAPPPA